MCQKISTLSIQQACMLVSLLLLLSFGVDGGGNLIRTLPGFPGDLPFKLETGYVGVGEYESVQLYYYFVESQRDPVNDPLILWLTGGPGSSGLSSMLYEVGPFQFDYIAFNGSLPPLKSNPYAFTKVANMIFLDAPVGTGFSYAQAVQDYYIKDDIEAANANYQFIQKWLLDHPVYLDNSLYIGGDSYSGKIVPILVHEIHRGQKNKHLPKMNLQGYILGNPATDKVDGTMHVAFAHRLGLISDELYESTIVNCGDEYLFPNINNALCLHDQEAIKMCTEAIYGAHVLEPNCNFSPGLKDFGIKGTLVGTNISVDEIVGALHGKNNWCRDYNYVLSYLWANDPEVQEALHVREGTKDVWKRFNATIAETYPTDIVASVVNYHQSFFNSGYRALIYSGDHDMGVSYVGTVKWIASLNLTLSEPWRPWMVDYQAAGLILFTPNSNLFAWFLTVLCSTNICVICFIGFTRTFIYKDTYELTFATVKGAGHTAPEFKPKPCLEMLDRWLAHSKL